jgi:hypothetical protein
MPNADAADPRPVATSHRGAAWSLVRWLVFSLLLAIVAVIACLPAIVGTPERVTKLIATAIPELAADVAKSADVGMLAFTHIVPSVPKLLEFALLGEAGTRYDGPISVMHDGDVISISGPKAFKTRNLLN